MTNKIIIHSVRHQKIALADILPNPHRDLVSNPIIPEKVENLLKSYEATGFWDNILVRPHPTREGKFQKAYGHTRFAALKDKRVDVDYITLPVANLTDWQMYEAMVSENELFGRVTPAIAIENVSVGCDMVEAALIKIGPEGTWEEFNKAIGRASVSTGTDAIVRPKFSSGFERVRDAFFNGEGLGRGFLVNFLPCGDMRAATIQEIVASRYGDRKAAIKKAEAERLMEEAEAAAKAGDRAKAKEKKEKADKAAAEAEAATKNFSQKVLRKFSRARTATDFCKAARTLKIPKSHHEAAADFIINGYGGEGFSGERKIAEALGQWWRDVQETDKDGTGIIPEHLREPVKEDKKSALDLLQFDTDLNQIDYLIEKMRKTLEPYIDRLPMDWVNGTVEEMLTTQDEFKKLLEFVRKNQPDKRAHLHTIKGGR